MARPYNIAGVEGYSWGRRIGVFAAILGFLWLLLDPLDFFGIRPSLLQDVGIVGYAATLLIPAALTFGSEVAVKRNRLEKMDPVEVTILNTRTGARDPVRVPHDMNALEFIRRYLGHKRSEYYRRGMQDLTSEFEWDLLLPRGRGIVQGQETLREGGIQAGDELRLQGRPRKPTGTLLYMLVDFGGAGPRRKSLKERLAEEYERLVDTLVYR